MAPEKRSPPVQSVAEPDSKKVKTSTDSKKEAEEQIFEEPDSVVDNRASLKTTVGFATEETTLNVLPTWGGRVLTPIMEGGMAYLLAGARASVGQKAGRYMFEVKIVQCMQTAHAGQKPKQLVRVGFSTSSSSLILGEDESVCFDCDGFFTSENKRATGGQRFGKDQVVSVVLNLDPKSPNFNTITLYKEGAKVVEPKPLPEALKGKTLFPHVVFRNVSIAVNFGPVAMKELPFKCRLIQNAAASDVVVTPSKVPKDGKYEVVLPVAFPDEGTFDWLDAYLEKNPQYVELSDRKIIEWAKSSGFLTKASNKASNDRPSANFGVLAVDDFSARKVIAAVAPVVPRNYLIMEVRSNLLASERKQILKKFNYPCYKRIAHVVMGEPDAEFKAFTQKKILENKQEKAQEAWKKTRADILKQKQIKQRERDARKRIKAAQKAKEELKKKVIAQAKVKETERKAKLAEKKAKEEAAKNNEEYVPMKDGDKSQENGLTEEAEEKKEEEEEKKEDSESEEEPEEDMETEAPLVELDDEDKNMIFLSRAVPDLTPQVMSSSYRKFTTPDEDEGFDEIRYAWHQHEKADEYLKTWVVNKKRTTPIEDLSPGAAFVEKYTFFGQSLQEWQEKQKVFGKTAPANDEDVEKPEHKKAGFDIFSVENIMDVCKGAPLFESFSFEDWALVQLRFELYILVISFRTDADDAALVGVPMDHLAFYYTKYFHKQLSPKVYGFTEIGDLLALISDTVATKDGHLITQISEDIVGTDIFVKLAEENRRIRQRRMDAGDDSLQLKFLPTAKVQTKILPVVLQAAAAARLASLKLAKPAQQSQSWTATTLIKKA